MHAYMPVNIHLKLDLYLAASLWSLLPGKLITLSPSPIPHPAAGEKESNTYGLHHLHRQGKDVRRVLATRWWLIECKPLLASVSGSPHVSVWLAEKERKRAFVLTPRAERFKWVFVQWLGRELAEPISI